MMSTALRAWAATGVATLASTYALDAISAATGAALVASGLLDGAGLGAAAALLAASYLAWGAALRPSLAANWDLLERTGASTCLPSKIAHDVARRRRFGLRGRRLATAAGYVGAELVKEAPYYFGAAGAAALAEGVSAADAVVFLAGANLGAAAYEFGLARATRRYLSSAEPPGYASFEDDWDAARYLAEYYRAVEADERHTLAYLVEAARDLPAPPQSVLIFGAGPTVHHALPFAERAETIDFSDFLPRNLAEIRAWAAAAPGAHDWSPFARFALACEGRPTDATAVAAREARLRARVGRLLVSDLREARPLGAAPRYDVVVSAFCADSATGDPATWLLYQTRIAALVRPGGALIVAALRRCRGYTVGGRTYPSANIDESDLLNALAPLATDLRIESRLLPDAAGHGYGGILLARCRIRPDRCAEARLAG